MKQLKVGEYMEESIRLLVRLCGIEAVRRALEKVAAGDSYEVTVQRGGPKRGAWQPVPLLVANLLTSDPAKHRVLAPFFEAVCKGELLREPEDMRRFVEIAGVKALPGKARRDLVPKLAQVLVPLSIARLEALLPRAQEYSAEIRSEGFSVLAAKILDDGRR